MSKAFFTTDDGATLFAEDISRISPFDHDGREAVRAFVFTCDGGKHQWVQCLQKFEADAKRQLEGYNPQKGGRLPSRVSTLVKRPGASGWNSAADPRSTDIVEPHCPEGMGAGRIEPVLP